MDFAGQLDAIVREVKALRQHILQDEPRAWRQNILREERLELKLERRMKQKMEQKIEIKKYRKRPVVVEAYRTENEVVVHTLEGDLVARPGDYIITGVRGEQYPCRAEIFEETYEEVEEAGDERSFD